MNDLKLKSRTGIPLYVTVKDAVRGAIERGRYRPGQKLPSTKVLSEQLGVSLVTVHRAMQELVAAGALRRGQGKGTFVHEDYVKRCDKSHGVRVGLVLAKDASFADTSLGHILEGIRREADELGIDLMLLRSGEDWRSECRGYLYVNPTPDQLDQSIRPARTNKTPGNGLPVVAVGAGPARPGVALIDTDDLEIGKAAVAHFVQHGHRRVGFVGGDGAIGSDHELWAGFVQACQNHDVEIVSNAVVRTANGRSDATGVAALAGLMKDPARPSAILAAGYGFAMCVYEAARSAGLEIPGELSVIGVDDSPSAAHLSPPLTTFARPLERIGRTALAELAELVVRGEHAPRKKAPSTELVVRGSVSRIG